MTTSRCRSSSESGTSPGGPLFSSSAWRSSSRAVGHADVFPVAGFLRACSAAPKSCFHRHGDRPDVVLRLGDPLYRRDVDAVPVAQPRGNRCRVRFILPPDQVVRCESRFERATTRAPIHRLALGLRGYSLLAAIAIFTIIGWAWVYVAQIRWMCRHIEGTRREVTFNATGLEFLWRSVVTALACVFIIPIPWMYRWFAGWLASQTVLVERGAQADARGAHLRSRSEPSCATEATSVPSCLKIMPRVRPRPPRALGESWA